MTDFHVRKDFEPSMETQLLIQHLRNIEIGETVTHEALAKIAGSTLARCRSVMRTVRHRLEVDHRIFLASVRGVGYVRINDAEAARQLEQPLQAIRRKARRAGRTAERIVFEHIPQSERTQFTLRTAALGAIDLALAPKSRDRLLGAAKTLGPSFSPRDALKALQED
jgi:hypothetical protein